MKQQERVYASRNDQQRGKEGSQTLTRCERSKIAMLGIRKTGQDTERDKSHASTRERIDDRPMGLRRKSDYLHWQQLASQLRVEQRIHFNVSQFLTRWL